MGGSVYPPQATNSVPVRAELMEKKHKTTWTDPSGKEHTIKFRIALNGREHEMSGIFTKWTVIDRGSHKILMEERVWKQIPEDQRESICARTDQIGARSLKSALPEVAKTLSTQFGEESDKIAEVVGSVFKPLARAAKRENGKEVKTSFEHKGTKYTVTCQQTKKGERLLQNSRKNETKFFQKNFHLVFSRGLQVFSGIFSKRAILSHGSP